MDTWNSWRIYFPYDTVRKVQGLSFNGMEYLKDIKVAWSSNCHITKSLIVWSYRCHLTAWWLSVELDNPTGFTAGYKCSRTCKQLLHSSVVEGETRNTCNLIRYIDQGALKMLPKKKKAIFCLGWWISKCKNALWVNCPLASTAAFDDKERGLREEECLTELNIKNYTV